jgi:hypothetical protein
MTYAQAATRAGFSASYLRHVENGTRPLTLDVAKAYDRAFATGGVFEKAMRTSAEPDIIGEAELRDLDGGTALIAGFTGASHLQIAVPLRGGERDFVAVEDSATGQRLSALANSRRLPTDVEYIPLSGDIDLNRDALVVVCGPKTSPITAAALSADPRLDFAVGPDGRWGLTDRRTGRTITSPSDDPEQPLAADVAYLGRLPRPDRAGTFLLIAGVHAIGSLGVAHYLAEHATELYDQVGDDPFSMIVGCEFDAATCTITSARALTAPLLHEVD